MSTDKKIDYILRTVEERDVRYLRLCFTDVLGGLKALSISPEELEEAFVEGSCFVRLQRLTALLPRSSPIFSRSPMQIRSRFFHGRQMMV